MSIHVFHVSPGLYLSFSAYYLRLATQEVRTFVLWAVLSPAAFQSVAGGPLHQQQVVARKIMFQYEFPTSVYTFGYDVVPVSLCVSACVCARGPACAENTITMNRSDLQCPSWIRRGPAGPGIGKNDPPKGGGGLGRGPLIRVGVAPRQSGADQSTSTRGRLGAIDSSARSVIRFLIRNPGRCCVIRQARCLIRFQIRNLARVTAVQEKVA